MKEMKAYLQEKNIDIFQYELIQVLLIILEEQVLDENPKIESRISGARRTVYYTGILNRPDAPQE